MTRAKTVIRKIKKEGIIMAAYNNIDDVTKKRLEKNHEKMQVIYDDPVVTQMLEDARREEKSDLYIVKAEKELTGDPLHDAFYSMIKYRESIRGFMEALGKNSYADAITWYKRYCWVSPMIVTAGFAILNEMGKNLDDYMRDADSSVQEYSEANVTTALNEAEKITEKAAKNAPETVAYAAARVFENDFSLSKYFDEKINEIIK